MNYLLKNHNRNNSKIITNIGNYKTIYPTKKHITKYRWCELYKLPINHIVYILDRIIWINII